MTTKTQHTTVNKNTRVGKGGKDPVRGGGRRDSNKIDCLDKVDGGEREKREKEKALRRVLGNGRITETQC